MERSVAKFNSARNVSMSMMPSANSVKTTPLNVKANEYGLITFSAMKINNPQVT